MDANKFGKRNRKGEIDVHIETIGIHIAPVFILLRESVPNFSPEYNDLAAEIWKCGIVIATERDTVIAELRDEIAALQSQFATNGWKLLEKEKPEIDQECLVVANGKVTSATYDYWCPVSSEERSDKWIIYRDTRRIIYLECPVIFWRPTLKLPDIFTGESKGGDE